MFKGILIFGMMILSSTVFAQSKSNPTPKKFDKMCGYVKGTKVLTPIQFDRAGDFDENCNAIVEIQNHWGTIDSSGKLIEDKKMIIQKTLTDGNLMFCYGTWESYTDRDDNIKIPTVNNDGKCKEPKYGILDTKNLIISLEPAFDDVIDFNGHIGAVKTTDRYQIITKTDDKNINVDSNFYDAVKLYATLPLAAVEISKKWVLINDKIMILSHQYDEIGNFSASFASVRTGKQWGFIDMNGQLKIDTKFAYIGDFIKNNDRYYASIQQEPNGKYNFINDSGLNPFKDFTFDKIIETNSEGGYVLVTSKGDEFFVNFYDNSIEENKPRDN